MWHCPGGQGELGSSLCLVTLPQPRGAQYPLTCTHHSAANTKGWIRPSKPTPETSGSVSAAASRIPKSHKLLRGETFL